MGPIARLDEAALCALCAKSSTAQLTIFAAGINVVKARRLWPRSFFSDELHEADRRALTASAEIEERVPQENVEVDFDRHSG